jgi:hypothetical protein
LISVVIAKERSDCGNLHIDMNKPQMNPARPRASPLAATKGLKVGSCESGELFFASAFLFTASFSCEGSEKRTTAKNKRPKVPF